MTDKALFIFCTALFLIFQQTGSTDENWPLFDWPEQEITPGAATPTPTLPQRIPGNLITTYCQYSDEPGIGRYHDGIDLAVPPEIPPGDCAVIAVHDGTIIIKQDNESLDPYLHGFVIEDSHNGPIEPKLLVVYGHLELNDTLNPGDRVCAYDYSPGFPTGGILGRIYYPEFNIPHLHIARGDWDKFNTGGQSQFIGEVNLQEYWADEFDNNVVLGPISFWLMRRIWCIAHSSWASRAKTR